MLRQATQRRLVIPAKPVNACPWHMINRPTVAPTVEAGGQLPVMEIDPCFAIKVSTAGIQSPVKIVLFDGGRGYQLGLNFAMDAQVSIEGLTADYQFILNDIFQIPDQMSIAFLFRGVCRTVTHIKIRDQHAFEYLAQDLIRYRTGGVSANVNRLNWSD